jgi:hypothetical protein
VINKRSLISPKNKKEARGPLFKDYLKWINGEPLLWLNSDKLNPQQSTYIHQ